MKRRKHNWGYRYDFNVPLREKTEKGWFTKEWDKYESSGDWRGYYSYARPMLDYRYVEQMVNMLAAQHNIHVRRGNSWAIDIKAKVLEYNPNQLRDGTKGSLIATILHEIGHLRYSTYGPELVSTYLKQYPSAYEVINCLEDLRVDDLMTYSYPSSEDIYIARKPIIKAFADSYRKKSDSLRLRTIEILERAFSDKLDDGIKEKIKLVEKSLRNKETLFDYCASLILVGYGEETIDSLYTGEKIKDYLRKTTHVIDTVIASPNQQDYMPLLDKEVFPIIEPLLIEQHQGFDEVAKAFGELIARQVMELIEKDDAKTSPLQAARTIQAGKGSNDDMTVWNHGDYNLLRDSVKTDIVSLSRKFTILRREELVERFIPQQKRGKLNTKNLYKQRLGSTRLFKHRGITNDTIRSFAFSLFVDISGSMYQSRIPHAVRGSIIFAEVFDTLGIPFEYYFFGEEAYTVRKFNSPYTKQQKKKIAGVLLRGGEGGTDIEQSIKRTQLHTRPEKNKILCVLTDGEDDRNAIQTRVDTLRKKGIKTIFVAICTDPKGLENAIDIKDPKDIPKEFVKLIKSLMLKK